MKLEEGEAMNSQADEPIRVAIVGSRNYPNLAAVRNYIESLPMSCTIISGGARGVDKAAEKAAKDRRMSFELYPAEWDKYGRSAGFKRNAEMVKRATWVVAFWDLQSRGTAHSIRLAMEAGKLLKIFTPYGELKRYGVP